jgi:hypothetical protein
MLPSSLTSFCHLFRGLPQGLVDSKFIYSTVLGIPYMLYECRYFFQFIYSRFIKYLCCLHLGSLYRLFLY